MHHPVPDTVIDALMALLAEKPFEAITLSELAERAGLSLGALREAADDKLSILAAFMRRIDRAVLDEAEPAGEDSGRDRLFDIIMRRYDRLAFYKPALANLSDSARRDPALALAINHLALPSSRYMLAASGIGTEGLRGLARTQGLALLLGRLLPVWLEDADPDQSRTMAALDKALERASGWDQRAGMVAKAVCRMGRRFGSSGSRQRPAAAATAPSPAAPEPDVAA